MTEPDYILIAPTIHNKGLRRRYLVAIMRWRADEQGHVMMECSDELTIHGARHLAHEWAKGKGLEVRE